MLHVPLIQILVLAVPVVQQLRTEVAGLDEQFVSGHERLKMLNVHRDVRYLFVVGYLVTGARLASP